MFQIVKFVCRKSVIIETRFANVPSGCKQVVSLVSSLFSAA